MESTHSYDFALSPCLRLFIEILLDQANDARPSNQLPFRIPAISDSLGLQIGATKMTR